MERGIVVEYDLGYTGGDYSLVGSFITLTPKQLKEHSNDVEQTFQSVTGFSPLHIIHYEAEDED